MPASSRHNPAAGRRGTASAEVSLQALSIMLSAFELPLPSHALHYPVLPVKVRAMLPTLVRWWCEGPGLAQHQLDSTEIVVSLSSTTMPSGFEMVLMLSVTDPYIPTVMKPFPSDEVVSASRRRCDCTERSTQHRGGQLCRKLPSGSPIYEVPSRFS
ncbi:hypothetical protein B0T20DRAFT_398106 [Sordaria brevicollis]|uniref:Uncharacterized protein n=1 Tax=Sordaria brevicollis TaxID=83679 RepID=A0AAE0U2F0_SORBR|nr:hypothetical protein B0T20DRAFT_398106 [Sordaria brevicollis]